MTRSMALSLTLALTLPFSAHGDPVTTSTLGWTINGIVSEVSRAGDVAFVGGSFATVAPSANLVPTSRRSPPTRRCRCCRTWT